MLLLSFRIFITDSINRIVPRFCGQFQNYLFYELHSLIICCGPRNFLWIRKTEFHPVGAPLLVWGLEGTPVRPRSDIDFGVELKEGDGIGQGECSNIKWVLSSDSQLVDISLRTKFDIKISGTRFYFKLTVSELRTLL